MAISDDDDFPRLYKMNADAQDLPRKRKFQIDLNEISFEAISTCKGNYLEYGDKLTIHSIGRPVRLVNSRNGLQVVKLNLDDSFLVSTLYDLCNFEFIIIYVPEKLKIADFVYLNCHIQLKSAAFNNNIVSQIGEALKERKDALELLFSKTGLLPPDHTGSRSSQPSLKGNSGSTTAALYNLLGVGGEDSSFSGLINMDYQANIEPMKPAAGMDCILQYYQEQALSFMFGIENDLSQGLLSPLWTKLSTIQGEFYFNRFLGQLSTDPPQGQTQGGILADDMGLGKTIEMLSLIHTNSGDQATPDYPSEQKKKTISNSATLVIAPLNLVDQWKSEVQRFFHPSVLRASIFHSSEKLLNLNDSTNQIVITTYGTLASEFTKSNSPLYKHNWFRIVLDEAHMIKDSTTRTFKACHALSSKYRWCITGTPIVNKLEYKRLI
jgi:DNA repair protein RAD5